MQKVNYLLDLPNLSSEKPSVLMDNILSLWPDTATKNMSKQLLGLFMRRLPMQMRSQPTSLPMPLKRAPLPSVPSMKVRLVQQP